MIFPFSACGTEPASNPDVPDDPGVNDESSSSDDSLYIVKDGMSDYLVIRSEDSPRDLTSLCGQFYTTLVSTTGAKLKITTDYDNPEDPDKPEIIVGNCKRTVASEVLAQLGDAEFTYRVVGKNLVIIGKTDQLTILALQLFIDNFSNHIQKGVFQIPGNLNFTMNYRNYLLSQQTQGSSQKKQYSDYIDRYTETQLLDFDSVEIPSSKTASEFTASLDTVYQREGDGALRFEVTRDTHIGEALWLSDSKGEQPFVFSVEDRHKTTLKLWLYVDDVTKIACDHDSDTTVFSDQATFFFRLFDKNGGVYCWNHTLQENGWHEVELTFNVHNGVSGDFDFGHIVNFGVLVTASAGAMFEIDDLRVVKYETDYVPEQLPNGGRLISNAEYDALDGFVIQEWYGCSYDKDEKYEGKSSIRYEGNSKNSDSRAVIANLDYEMDYNNDSIVFFINPDSVTSLRSIFIELNEVQDTHEYEQSFSLEKLFEYGLAKTDKTWSCVKIPLSDFRKNLKEGMGDTVRLHNCRIVVSGYSSETNFLCHLDHIFLMETEKLCQPLGD